MKVLHFIPSISAIVSSRLFRYKLALVESMSENADVHILTTGKANISLGRAVIHTFSPAKNILSGRFAYFDKFLSLIRPDVVHIHACWSLQAFYFQKKCIKYHIPVVITFDKQLETWHFSHFYWTVKLPLLTVFQRYMIIHAEALQAISGQEHSHLMTLGWYPGLKVRRCLNERIATVGIFDRTYGKTAGNMAEELILLYQKVTDSNPFIRMTDTDRCAEDLLLMSGVSQSHRDSPVTGMSKSMPYALSNESWRRLLLHSADEGVFDHIVAGAKRYGVALPAFDVDKIDRFARRSSAADNDDDVSVNEKIKMLKSDDTFPELERDICLMLVAVLLKIDGFMVHRSDFVALYGILRFNNYDEELLCQKIRELKIQKRTGRLFQILKERYGLEEGFMFTEPVNDRGTEKLRRMFLKSNIQ